MAREIIRTDELMVPIAHFSHGVRVGSEIHLGATAGTDRARRLAGTPPGLTDARAQAERMYSNMKLALRLLGGDMTDVVRLKVYLTDWRDKEACDQAYAAHFAGRKLAVATVGSWGFPLPFAVVEAELTAHVGGAAAHHHDCVTGTDAAQAFANLGVALARADLQARDVVSVNATLADLRDLPALEEAWAAFFRPPYPPRTVSVAPLADMTLRVSLETTALKGGGEPVEPPGLFRVPGAASTAMQAGDHLYISAQPGLDGEGRLAGGVAEQTRAAWQRINAVLERARMDATSVVRTNNWLTDWRAYKAFNGAYGEFVTPPYPPRATLVAGLAEPSALVQIETLAHRGGSGATVLQASREESI